LIQYCPNGCSGNSCQNNIATGTLTVTKTVRDLTNSSGFSSSTYANPSDMLMFMITLQANGSDVQNVTVRDTIPANLIYSNQLVVACTGSNGNNGNCNNNYNSSGNIVSGINLNTIYAGQTVTVTYQAQVAGTQNFTYGTTTLNDPTDTTSSSSGYVPEASASAIVTRSTVLGASTVSTGLTNNFWVDSFFLPLLITLICLGMWKSGMFFGIEKWLDNKKRVRRSYRAERELSTRIAKIQKLKSR
jgi:fimbrial isopeptide formation D2 family protein